MYFLCLNTSPEVQEALPRPWWAGGSSGRPPPPPSWSGRPRGSPPACSCRWGSGAPGRTSRSWGCPRCRVWSPGHSGTESTPGSWQTSLKTSRVRLHSEHVVMMWCCQTQGDKKGLKLLIPIINLAWSRNQIISEYDFHKSVCWRQLQARGQLPPFPAALTIVTSAAAVHCMRLERQDIYPRIDWQWKPAHYTMPPPQHWHHTSIYPGPVTLNRPAVNRFSRLTCLLMIVS